MKKFIISLTTALMLVASCSLDEGMYTNVYKDGYIKDAKSARNVLFGLYRNLGNQELYGFRLSIVYDLPTDIAKVNGTTLDNNRDICNNAHTAANSWVQNTWRYLYNTIYNANDFIERAEAAVKDGVIPENDLPAVNVYIAEAKVIRALMYFELVRNWKNITLIKTTAQAKQHASTFRQDDPVDVYEYIEQDLIDASEVLPWSTADIIRTDNSFMMSKASALGLLARVYVTWAGYPLNDASKWQLAKDACAQVIDSGQHQLLEDYEELWRNSCNSKWNPKESLIEVSFYSPTISSSAELNNSGVIGKWNGVYVVTNTTSLVRVDARYRATPTFAAKWPDPENDKRFGISLADYHYEGTNVTGYYEKLNSMGQNVPYINDDTDIEGIKRVYRAAGRTKKNDFLLTRSPEGQMQHRYAFQDGVYVGKWDLVKYVEGGKFLSDGNYSNANWYVLRYSDVLLMYAEAENEINGPTLKAYDAINTVRRRGYAVSAPVIDQGQEPTVVEDDSDLEESETYQPATVADLPSGLSQEQFRQAVRDERAYELCFEGNRKQDLIRWGIYAETVIQTDWDYSQWVTSAGDYYLAGKYTVKGKNELQPIPQRDKDLMPLYKQNPGWE